MKKLQWIDLFVCKIHFFFCFVYRVNKGLHPRIPTDTKIRHPLIDDKEDDEFKKTNKDADRLTYEPRKPTTRDQDEDSDDDHFLQKNRFHKIDYDPVSDQIFELNTEQLLSKDYFPIQWARCKGERVHFFWIFKKVSKSTYHKIIINFENFF